MKKINSHKYVFLLPCVLLIAVMLVVGIFAKDISLSSETTSSQPKNISNSVYYYDPETGKMAMGLTQIGEYKYLFRSDGALGQLMTGWHKVNDEWHYFEQGGAIDGTRGKMRKDT